MDEKYHKRKLAFSLIELSIVLIIIGLLVAGVTGGASLIQSARVRSAINDMNEWSRNFHTFYAAKERLPGDINNDGCVGRGYGSGCGGGSTGLKEEPNSTDFPGEYKGTVVTSLTGPYVDLYLEGISTFKPEKANSSNGITNDLKSLGRFYPQIKSFGKVGPLVITINNLTDNSTNSIRYKIKNGYYMGVWSYSSYLMDKKLMDTLDKKIDDSLNYEGNFRYAIQSGNNKTVDHVYFRIMDSL